MLGSSKPTLITLFCLPLLLSACWQPDNVSPAAELSLLDGQLSCDAKTGSCVALGGGAVNAEPHRVRVRARVMRRGDRGTLQLQLRLTRRSGARATLALALPFGEPSPGIERPTPTMAYEELLAGQRVFTSNRATGRVELSLDRSCACQTGRFELAFVDSGPDGVVGTADDKHRRLSAGRLRLDARPFCHRRQALPIKSNVLVLGLRSCPSRRGGAAVPSGACGWGFGVGADGWIDDWNDEGWYDEDWVGDWSDDEDADYDDGSGWEDDRGWDDGADGWSGWHDEVPSSPGGGDWGSTGGDGWADWGCTSCGDSWDDWGDSWGDDSWGDGGGGGWGDDSWGDDGWGDDGWGDDDWGDDDWGDDDWGDDDWGDDDWGDDDWGDDDWGDDDWDDDGW
jgi:hypothetical protein